MEQLGLQVLICALCSDTASRALVITPKPASVLLAGLRDGIRAELASRSGGDDAVPVEAMAARTRECLDRVMLSCVFDMDGLWEVLADLDRHVEATSPVDVRREKGRDVEEGGEVGGGVEAREQSASAVSVIEDSEDEDEGFSPGEMPAETSPEATRRDDAKRSQHGQDTRADTEIPQSKPASNRPVDSRQLPDIIVITHFSTLLTALFTHRDKTAAHSTLQLLGSHLRHLSRSLPSSPLIILLNSTAASNNNTTTANPDTNLDNQPPYPHPQATQAAGNTRAALAKPLDSTLRSIFNPPSYTAPSAASDVHNHQPYYPSASVAASRRNKPSFGLVFSQMLDMHLLLSSRVPRSISDAEVACGGRGGAREAAAVFGAAVPRFVSVVEVLLDEMGVWEGVLGARRRREQRWAAVDVVGGRLVDAFDT